MRFHWQAICSRVAISILLLPGTASAQSEFEVTAFRKSSSSYYEIILQGTKKDQEYVCALKNDAGVIIATDTQYGNALATKVLIRYEGSDAKSAVCVLNN
jgi:hypothetical protein